MDTINNKQQSTTLWFVFMLRLNQRIFKRNIFEFFNDNSKTKIFCFWIKVIQLSFFVQKILQIGKTTFIVIIFCVLTIFYERISHNKRVNILDNLPHWLFRVWKMWNLWASQELSKYGIHHKYLNYTFWQTLQITSSLYISKLKHLRCTVSNLIEATCWLDKKQFFQKMDWTSILLE